MTATVFLPPTPVDRFTTSSPRLSLAPAGAAPALLGTSTASRPGAEADNPRTAAKNDRASEAVWNSEGGHVSEPAPRPPIPGATAGVPHQAKGM